MRIISTRTLHGPNVYHHLPVVLMIVDLEEWTDVPSTQIPNFVANLLKALPGLQTHHCSRGHEGGFIERLNEGTYMAHIIEHLALELSVLSGIEAGYGKTRYAGKPGRYEIVTRFKNEEGMRECLRQAVDLAQACATSAEFNLAHAVEDIQYFVKKTKLGPSAQALLDAAKKRKIPVRRLGEDSLLRLGYGKKIRRIQAAVSDMTSLVAADIAQDKNWTKTILRESFLPVPKGEVVSTTVGLQDALEIIHPPYAVKPFNGNHGNGVALNLMTPEEVLEAFTIAKKYSPSVLIEEMCPGRDYRILVVNGKMVAAAERLPPTVTGDGVKTIQQLIDEMNLDPRRGNGHENVMTKIEVDEIMLAHLLKHGHKLDTVLPAEQSLILRQNANLSSGGSAVDVTTKVHPEVRIICERAARVVGLDICGLDIIHSDIANPPEDQLKIIEMNAGPGLRMHLAPSEGEAQRVGEPIIDMLYPNDDQGRIPITSVTGTNGKTTVVRMLHKIFSDPGDKVVGLTTTDGIWIGTEKIFSGDTTGPQSSQLVLSDPKVDMAVLEVARGGLLRGGLAYDWSDVSIVTNIRLDHIGQDGIEDLEDLIWIKSVIAERVKEKGILVLNADDPASLSLKEHPRVTKIPKQFFLYSTNSQNQDLRSHRLAGGSACWAENGWIFVQHGSLFEKVAQIKEIPATLNGIAEFQVSNVLAVVAAAVANGARVSQIARSLKSFHPLQENMGRLNIYRIHDGYVLLDYGHNADAIEAIGKMLRHVPGYQKTAVFGMPGDRADRLIESGGEAIANYFDQFILKDDDDLRGREPVQTPRMIEAAIKRKNPTAKIEIIPNQIQAIHKALEGIGSNEIVAIFYEKLAPILSVLRQYDPQPVEFIPPAIPNLNQQPDSEKREEADHAHRF